MSVFYNKKLISGVRDVPHMTLAEYNALTNKPDLWLRTDAPESDRGISASDVEYSTGVSVEDKIDSNYGILNAKIQRKEFLQTQNLTFDNIPSTCTGLLFLRSFHSTASGFWFLIPVNVYGGSAVIDTPFKVGTTSAEPTGASYSNGTLTVTMNTGANSFFATLIYGN